MLLLPSDMVCQKLPCCIAVETAVLRSRAVNDPYYPQTSLQLTDLLIDEAPGAPVLNINRRPTTQAV